MRLGLEFLESKRMMAVDLLAQIPMEADARFLPRDLSPYNGSVLVRGSDGRVGPEVWISDGAPETTRLLKDIFVGPRGSGPSEFTEFQGRLFFSATNGFSGYELWVTAGTKASTQLVADLWPGGESGASDNLVVFEDQLYFFANDGETGRELYRSDGTAIGTQRVADSVLGRGGISGKHLMVVGEHMYFLSDSDTGGQSGLWVSDGSADGTRPVTFVGVPEPDLRLLTPMGHQLAFLAGNQLFVTDGSDRAMQIQPIGDQLGDNISAIAVAHGNLYITSDAGLQVIDVASSLLRTIGPAHGVVASNHAVLFWRSDGLFALDQDDESTLLIGFNPIFQTSMGTTFNVPGGMLLNINRARDRYEIWATDGTAVGTRLIETVTDKSSEPLAGFQQIGDAIYFTATNGNLQETVWRVPAPVIQRPAGPAGDLNQDSVVNAADVDFLLVAVRSASRDADLDLDQDGQVNQQDVDYLVEEILRSRRGDADLDGSVDFDDFVILSTRFGQLEVGWEGGDFNGDGLVDFDDFVLLSANFGFFSN